MNQGLNVAEPKKKFSELLARVAFKGERFVITRRGKPMAALIGLEDLAVLEEQGDRSLEPQGLSAAAGALADYEGFEETMTEVHRSRRQAAGRRVKLG